MAPGLNFFDIGPDVFNKERSQLTLFDICAEGQYEQFIQSADRKGA